MMKRAHDITTPISGESGFTLIEVVIVLVIAGILAAVAVESGSQIYESAQVEETRQELEALSWAVVGNPALKTNGVRSDFGYVGDVGSLPPTLAALYTNPGGFTTWNGPYVTNRFTQVSDDYTRDSWGANYAYSGGVEITSTGSGSSIVRKLGGSVSHLLLNRVVGVVSDRDGSPPGPDNNDSILVRLFIPDGAGSILIKSTVPDIGGYFVFDSIPIGNHDLEVIYSPSADTLRRFVSVSSRSEPYLEVHLASNVWYDTTGGGGISHVTGSDSLYADCNGFYFWIENNTGGDIVASSVTLTWTPPTSYYRYVFWDGLVVFDEVNPRAGSGEQAVFSSTQTIADGQKLRIDFNSFKSTPTGGAGVDMNDLTFSVSFSDGSSFSILTGACP